jgi:hypothetical protein
MLREKWTVELCGLQTKNLRKTLSHSLRTTPCSAQPAGPFPDRFHLPASLEHPHWSPSGAFVTINLVDWNLDKTMSDKDFYLCLPCFLLLLFLFHGNWNRGGHWHLWGWVREGERGIENVFVSYSQKILCHICYMTNPSFSIPSAKHYHCLIFILHLPLSFSFPRAFHVKFFISLHYFLLPWLQKSLSFFFFSWQGFLLLLILVTFK